MGHTEPMADCIFCKIVKGELPTSKVYENDRVFAFLDIHPVNAGHTLVIPKKHSKNVFDVAPEDWAAMTEAVRMLSEVIEKAVGANGINIGMNNREHAGQVVDHAHMHIIPRFKGDGFKLFPQRMYEDKEAETTLQKIHAALR